MTSKTAVAEAIADIEEHGYCFLEDLQGPAGPLVPQKLYAQFPARLRQLLERSVERTITNANSG